MSDMQQNSRKKRHRGVIVELVYQNHERQQSRMDDVMLWSLLTKLGYDVSQNDVLTLVQDLCDRGYLLCDEKKSLFTNRVSLFRIRLTAAGRDLYEGNRDDVAVLIPQAE